MGFLSAPSNFLAQWFQKFDSNILGLRIISMKNGRTDRCLGIVNTNIICYLICGHRTITIKHHILKHHIPELPIDALSQVPCTGVRVCMCTRMRPGRIIMRPFETPRGRPWQAMRVSCPDVMAQHRNGHRHSSPASKWGQDKRGFAEVPQYTIIMT